VFCDSAILLLKIEQHLSPKFFVFLRIFITFANETKIYWKNEKDTDIMSRFIL